MTDTTTPSYATPAQVAAWLGTVAPSEAAENDPIVIVTATANWTVSQLIGARTYIPPDVARHAVLALASDLFEQRNAPNGIRMFTDGLGGTAPMRVRADSAARARSILGLAPVIL